MNPADFAYAFIEKCAEYNIDPMELYKYAARGDMLKKLIARHVYKGLKVAQQEGPFLSEVENKAQKKRLEAPGKGIKLQDIINASRKVKREGFNNRIGIKYNHGYPSSSTK
jgi:hypothetical protein